MYYEMYLTGIVAIFIYVYVSIYYTYGCIRYVATVQTFLISTIFCEMVELQQYFRPHNNINI